MVLEDRIKLATAERQMDYIGDSRNKNISTFLKEQCRNRVRIRLLIRTVKKYI